jgi:hypothetical protein
MRYKDVLLATRSDLRDALMARDTEKAERIYQECEAEYQKHQPCDICKGLGFYWEHGVLGGSREMCWKC